MKKIDTIKKRQERLCAFLRKKGIRILNSALSADQHRGPRKLLYKNCRGVRSEKKLEYWKESTRHTNGNQSHRVLSVYF